jgi:sulfatase modifying factor 1
MGKAPKLIVALVLALAFGSGLVATFAAGSKSASSRRHPEMVWIAGGPFWMGSDSERSGTRPRKLVRVRGFWLDTTEVSNQQFTQFVRATGYVTEAERPPRRRGAPHIPVDKLVAGSLVFTPPHDSDALDNPDRWWRFVPGADWQHPEGPESDLIGRMQHPVVHIAHADALAYAKWAHKRLPTEAEWEFAAQTGSGSAAKATRAEVLFPHADPNADGSSRTAPVASFPPNRLGLFDMAGNVWEWVADYDRPDYYRERATSHAGFRCARDTP